MLPTDQLYLSRLIRGARERIEEQEKQIEELEANKKKDEEYIRELQLVINRLIKGEKPVCNVCELSCLPSFDGKCELCES